MLDDEHRTIADVDAPEEEMPNDDQPSGLALALSASPADAAPGQTMTVRVQGMRDGAPVALSTAPTFSSSAGKITTPEQDDDGWSVLWTRPEGDASIEASLGDALVEYRTTGSPRLDDEPAERHRAIAEQSDRWLRARVSGVVGGYRYEQLPDAQPGPLLDTTFAMGGSRGGSAATPAGVEGELRVFIPGADFLGAMGRIRGASYAIDSDVFSDPAEDWLVNGAAYLLLRAPLSLGNDRLWFGGRGGYRYDDVMFFRGCTDPGCTIDFDGLGLPGLGLGGEVGAEIGRFSFIGGFEQGLAQGNVPHSQSIDLHLGVEVARPMLIDVGFVTDTRTMPLIGMESDLLRGTVEDNQWLVTLGLGFALR